MKRLVILIILFSQQVFASQLIIDDPIKLQKLEKGNFAFDKIVSAKNYQSIVKVLARDLDEIKKSDKYLSVTMAKKHRLFDKRWFNSKYSFYELVGVFNRIDRTPFAPEQNYSCGEVRLIYRLAYRKTKNKEEIYTRLPFTFNVVFWLTDQSGKGEDCREMAKNLFLEKYNFQNKYLKSIEVNFQAVRWPSTVRPDFGGYAEYLMRVFKPTDDGQSLAPAEMENMIDVEKISKSNELKKELLLYLKDKSNIKSFDEGVGVVPNKFLAKKAISAAFHGMARLKNRPFDQVYNVNDFKDVDFSKREFVKTPTAYLRRLNDMSCVGCHQGRAIAGFHFVGVDRPDTHAANSVKMARSGHLQLDLKRRKKYFAELLQGKKPDQKRGFSERLETEEGKYGAHCSLGKDVSFSSWTCEKGLKCQSLDKATSNDVIGVCLPEVNKFSGDPCDVGRVSQNADSRKDRVIKKISRACRSDQYCFSAGAGFPGGLCHEYCNTVKKGETCGLIAFNGFNGCLFANKPFTECLREHTGKITMKSCDEENPCRDDFVCTSAGACLPPYFLFQLRADGHLTP